MESAVRTAAPASPSARSLKNDSAGTEVSEPEQGSSASITLTVLLAAVVAQGLYLRFWLIAHAPGNSDEATVGLIARGILHGHFSTFIWGQSYGGVEPYVVAVVFAVAGQSEFSLALAPAILSLLAAIVVWRIGRRLFGGRPGLVAAVLSWIWCESSLRNSTRETGFHEVELVLGLLVLLQILRIRDVSAGAKGDSAAGWFVIGALIGLGWWAGPEIVYFALPAAVFLLLSLRHRARAEQGLRLGAAVGGFALCAAPWFAASFSEGRAILQTPGGTALSGAYVDRLSIFFTHVLPIVLGLRVENTGVWEVAYGFAIGLYIVFIVALEASLLLLWRRIPAARPLVAIAAAYPLLYAAFPSNWYWNDGRYSITLTPLVALVVVGGLWIAVSGPVVRWVSVIILAAATVSTLVAFNDGGVGAATSLRQLATWGTNPNFLVISLSNALRTHGVVNVYAGYWVGYDLQFSSGDRIAVMAVQSDRNLTESAAVEAASSAGWVFVDPSSRERAVVDAEFGAVSELDPGPPSPSALEAWLTAHRVSYRTFSDGPFEVVVPSRNVTPAQVLSLGK
jgi:hypothetical protein